MIAPPDFQSYYDSTLRPVLELLEVQRKQVLRALSFAWLSLLLIIPAVLPTILFQNAAWLLLLIAPVIYSIIRFKDAFALIRQYVTAFKQKVVGTMITAFGSDLMFDPQQGISLLDYQQSDLFRTRCDTYRTGDMVSGKVGATAIQFSEVLHQVRVQTGKSSHMETVFKGIFFIADFNKNFHGRTFVFTESKLDFFGISKVLEEWTHSRGDLVKLEDPRFEKAFKVFSNDQVEARYILSTAMMERIIKCRDKIRDSLSIAFFDSRIFIAFPLHKNLFEPNIYSSGLKEDYLREYFDYLEFFIGVVDELDLNTRIWTKQ